MTYDENRISDQIDGGLHLKNEIQETAHEMYENMFYAIPSKGITVKEHDEAAKKCAKLAAIVGKYNSPDSKIKYWEEVIRAIENI